MDVPHGDNERLQVQLLLPPLSAAANLALIMGLYKNKNKDKEMLGYNGGLLN